MWGKHFFVDDFAGVVGGLLLALRGIAYKKNPMLGFSLAVLSTVCLEIWAINTAAACREKAIHCDKK